MIEKRPLFFATLSLVLGEVVGQCVNQMVFVVGFFIVTSIVFCVIISRKFLLKKELTQKQYRFYKKKEQRMPSICLFLFLCILFLIGGWHNRVFRENFRLPEAYEEGEEVFVVGTVIEKSNSDYGMTYRIKRPIMKKQGRDSRKLKGDLLIYGLTEKIELGEVLCISGELKALQEPTNPGQFDQKTYQMARGILGTIKKAKLQGRKKPTIKLLEKIWQLKEAINRGYQKTLDEKEAGLLMAMVTGEKSLVDPEIKSLYQNQGIAHVLAISGLHVAFVGRSMFRFLRKHGFPYQIAGSIGMILVIGYGTLVGKTASVSRGCMMLSVLLIGEVIGRSYDMLTSMSASALLLVLENPYCLQDMGFLLSFGAIVGIGICYPYYFSDYFVSKGKGEEKKETLNKRTGEIIKLDTQTRSWRKRIKENICVSLSIQMVTFPILLSTFYGFSPYSLLLNIWILPLMSLLLPSAMLGGILSIFSVFWARILLLPAVGILKFYEGSSTMMSLLPASFFITGAPKIKFYICYFLLVLIGGMLWKLRKRKTFLALFAMSAFCVMFDWEGNIQTYLLHSNEINQKEKLQVICLDVGQGDGILLSMPSNNHYLLDGGSSTVSKVGTYRILPLLKYYGIRSLDGVMITHFDADHYNGVEQILTSIPVKKLLLPRLMEKDEEYIQFEQLAKSYKIPIFYVGEGDHLQDGEVEIQWLSPANDNQKEDKNDNSQVFFLTYKQFRGIFTGDMGEEREEELLSQLSPCTFLKVGHHGSKYSSSNPFLECVKPKYSAISYGVGNRYGHPTKEALERIEQVGSQIYETGKVGAIFMETDGRKIRVYGYCEQKR